MGFKSKILSLFKLTGRAAVTIATNPITGGLIAELPFGKLATTIFSAITSAQEANPQKGAGESRLTHAMSIVGAASPWIIAEFERATGKEVVDEDMFAAGVRMMNDAQVMIANSMRLLPPAGSTEDTKT